MSPQESALVAGALLVWVAAIYLLMASGWRRGELVWSGRQPRLLDPGLRMRSLLFGLGLVASAWVLMSATGLVGSPIPTRWEESATFAVMAFLGGGLVYCLIAGSRWERMFFAPILGMGALMAAWLTFA